MTYNTHVVYFYHRREERTRGMLIYEYKLNGTKAQYAAIDEAICDLIAYENLCAVSTLTRLLHRSKRLRVNTS